MVDVVALILIISAVSLPIQTVTLNECRFNHEIMLPTKKNLLNFSPISFSKGKTLISVIGRTSIMLVRTLNSGTTVPGLM